MRDYLKHQLYTESKGQKTIFNEPLSQRLLEIIKFTIEVIKEMNKEICSHKFHNANEFTVTKAVDLSEYERQMHEFFMQKALNLLEPHPKGLFAAIIVDYTTKSILAKGVDLDTDPTLHGEVSAIQNYYAKYGDTGWDNLILYSTAEPCPMCMSAIVWSGIKRVVWGTTLETQNSAGVGRLKVPAIYIVNHSRDIYSPHELISGVLADKTDPLFFSERNFRIAQVVNESISTEY